MGVISLGLTEKGLKGGFERAFGPKTDKTLYRKLAMRVESDRDEEHHRWLGSLPGMEEWGPGLKLHGLSAESYNVANMKYATGLEIDRDTVSDDQTQQIMKRVGQLGRQAALHKDELLGDLFENGASANFKSYDDAIFFSAAHETGASGAQDNDLTFTVADADVNVFTAAEGETALQNAISAMMSFLDDRGRPFKIQPTGLAIVCPVIQMFRWQKVVKTAVIDSTDNIMKGVAEVIPFSELSQTSGAWYLVKTDDAEAMPFIFQDREPITQEYLGPGSEEWVKRHKATYSVWARYRMAYGFWAHCVKTTYGT